MTPDRLKSLLTECYQRQREMGRPAGYDVTARFLGVAPITLRRWLRGLRPIPRAVAIVIEIFHAYPQVDGERIANLLLVDEELKQHSGPQKQHSGL
jgi:hypothetical protein